MQALDDKDRNLAIAAWAGILCVGPVLPLVVLAMSWGRPTSLARQQATQATAMWAVVLLVFLPSISWAAMADGPVPLVSAVWVLSMATVLGISIARVVQILQARVND